MDDVYELIGYDKENKKVLHCTARQSFGFGRGRIQMCEFIGYGIKNAPHLDLEPDIRKILILNIVCRSDPVA